VGRWEVLLMVMKIFVLGQPGSGKSTAVRRIKEIAQKRGYTVKSFNDYTILRKWADEAIDESKFRKTANGGFDVLDFTIFDKSLKVLEKRITQENLTSSKDIITIEFARNDYALAFEQFSASFRQNAYILFIDAENDTCKERIVMRAKHRHSDDDHPVSDDIFATYYYKKSVDCISSYLDSLHLIRGTREQQNEKLLRVTVIHNYGHNPKESFDFAIRQFALRLIRKCNLISGKPAKAKRIAKKKSFELAPSN